MSWIKKIAEDARSNNIFIGVYSVDTEEQLDFVLSHNVKAIVTNLPGKILSIFETNTKQSYNLSLKGFDNLNSSGNISKAKR